MKISDFKGIFKQSYAKIVSIENPFDDYYVIKLASDVEWQPGEHAIFKIPGKSIEGKKWRAFSIASITEEGFILIATRTGKTISSFKEVLLNLKVGDQVSMRGPFGWFKEQTDNRDLVLVAGGVGITPIRALLKSLESSNKTIHLLYSSKDKYLFKEEIDKLDNSKIHLHYIRNRDEMSEKLKEVTKENMKAHYYVSGSMAFIKSLKSQLKVLGIKKIINDPFLGY